LLSLKSHKLSFHKSGSICPVSTSWTVGSYVRARMRLFFSSGTVLPR
jgi:hypothetical protein